MFRIVVAAHLLDDLGAHPEEAPDIVRALSRAKEHRGSGVPQIVWRRPIHVRSRVEIQHAQRAVDLAAIEAGASHGNL